MQRVDKGARVAVVALLWTLLAGTASAQEGAIAGVVRDPSEAVVPGVLVEVASPSLIERVRSATTDGSGQYQTITGYNQTWTVDNPATPAIEVNNWGQPTGLVTPRFFRLSVQLDF
jgi:hypothetical protein